MPLLTNRMPNSRMQLHLRASDPARGSCSAYNVVFEVCVARDQPNTSSWYTSFSSFSACLAELGSLATVLLQFQGMVP